MSVQVEKLTLGQCGHVIKASSAQTKLLLSLSYFSSYLGLGIM